MEQLFGWPFIGGYMIAAYLVPVKPWPFWLKLVNVSIALALGLIIQQLK